MRNGNRKILLVGPSSIASAKAYGGGMGGYVRNFSVYLTTLSIPGYSFTPFSHTVRGQSSGLRSALLFRFLNDITAFAIQCVWRRPYAVHVLAQYRGALPREFAMAIISKTLRVRFIYDIKAGAFSHAYTSRGYLYRSMVKAITALSDHILAEGQSTCGFLKNNFGREAVYFPNFVPHQEVPDKANALFIKNVLRILFVGFCYRDKGIFELVQGCQIAAHNGLLLSLEIIGAESDDFKLWADNLNLVPGFQIVRRGRLSNAEVLAAMRGVDVYAYPTYHSGEGHNNTINEAMMNGLIVLTTTQGFLNDVLGTECAYFLDEVSPSNIASALQYIDTNKKEATDKAVKARNKLINEYTSLAATNRLKAIYK